jgi:hypothetical protein
VHPKLPLNAYTQAQCGVYAAHARSQEKTALICTAAGEFACGEGRQRKRSL